ncbi:hypothetical protein KIN20_032644 [Parelaphostrongylus tenuis]|uniref:Uncharacterized protein n=1 Tax=Parelaphostrongylus tenuis TaxID=148309 RepID=A0AAD5R784_PARTN|nr:hypothetical protein KIN20_032644 [Parelaphostrongylus tenuis]
MVTVFHTPDTSNMIVRPKVIDTKTSNPGGANDERKHLNSSTFTGCMPLSVRAMLGIHSDCSPYSSDWALACLSQATSNM